MLDALVAKLRLVADPDAHDLHVLEAAVSRVRSVASHHYVVREGDPPTSIHLLLSGFTCRYRLLDGGRRQITSILVPGDACDLHAFLLDRVDHNVMTLSECELAEISREALLDITQHHPRLARALWWCSLLDGAILHEWVVNVGRRDAEQRIAHLFCELEARLDAVGLAHDHSFEFPLTQVELADAVGISFVHANRTLQQLRSSGLIALKGKTLTIQDPDRLRALAEFDARYLHLSAQSPPWQAGLR